MSKLKFGRGIVRGDKSRAARKRTAIVSGRIVNRLALLPIFLVAAFSSSHASAGTVIDLGTAQIGGSVDSRTCFAADPCAETFDNKSGNESVETPYSSAKTTLNLSTIPSVTARAEADPLKGGGQAPTAFAAIGSAEVGLDYYFEIKGPQNISVPVLIQATASMGIAGDLTSGSQYNYTADADLFIGGLGLNINQQAFLETGSGSGATSGGYSIDRFYDLQSNTAYEVNMLVKSTAAIGLLSGSTLISTASIDPSFQIGPGYSGYSIAFSGGIGAPPVAAAPLPATLPLFAGGLGILGMIGRRKRKA